MAQKIESFVAVLGKNSSSSKSGMRHEPDRAVGFDGWGIRVLDIDLTN